MTPSRLSPPPSTADNAQGLTPEQLQFWDDNGYLIIENALDKSTVSTLLADARQMLNDFSIDEHPMTKFSTGEGEDKHVGDDYFLTSGDKVRFFFEEGVYPRPRPLAASMAPQAPPTDPLPLPADAFDATGALTKPKRLAINKIGHYLHELSPSYRHASLSPRNASLAHSLGFRDPRCLQSMVICKQPEIGGRVPPHQDSTFLYTNPPSAVGFWYALEDATAQNGCLSFAKGSHKRAPIRQRFVRRGEGEGTGFVSVDGARFPRGVEDEGGEEGEEEEYTIGEVKAGTLVLIHGNVMHKSERNTSGKSRFIYTFHVIEGENEYDGRNWLQPPERGFSRLEG